MGLDAFPKYLVVKMCKMKIDTECNILRLNAFGCFTHLLRWVIL